MPRAGLTKWPWAISIEKLRKSDGGNRNSGHAMSFSGRIPVPIKFGARSRRLPQAGARFCWLFFTWPIVLVSGSGDLPPERCGIVVWDGAKPPLQASSSVEQTPFPNPRMRGSGMSIEGRIVAIDRGCVGFFFASSVKGHRVVGPRGGGKCETQLTQ